MSLVSVEIVCVIGRADKEGRRVVETVETARLGSVLGESTGGKGWAKEEERERKEDVQQARKRKGRRQKEGEEGRADKISCT